MSKFKKKLVLSIVSIIILLIVISVFTIFFKKDIGIIKDVNGENSKYDYGITCVLENDLLKTVDNNESKFEKMYFDGNRLYLMIKKASASEYNLENVKIKNDNKDYKVNYIIDVDNENRLFVWDYIGIVKKEIVLEYNGIDGKKDFVFDMQDYKSNINKINKYYEEIYVEDCLYGGTSFYIRFKLNAYINPSSFQIQNNENVATGYIISSNNKTYEIVFPINIAPNDSFNIIVNGEDGMVNATIPIKHEQ